MFEANENHIQLMTLADWLHLLFTYEVRLVPTEATYWLLDFSYEKLGPRDVYQRVLAVGIGQRPAALMNDCFGGPCAIYAVGPHNRYCLLFCIEGGES